MRIGIDARHLAGGQPSGVDQYTLAVLRKLADNPRGHEFEVLTTGSKQAKARAVKSLAQIINKNSVTHTHVSVLNRLLNAMIFFLHKPRLENLFKTHPDAIWCPNINFISFGDTPIIITFHDLSFELFKEHYNFKRRLWHCCVKPRKLAQRASLVIAPSETTRNDLINMFSLEPDKIRVINHGVSEIFSSQTLPQDHGVRSRYDLPKNYILHVGTHEPRKNLETLVRGFLSAHAESDAVRRLDLKLVLAGARADVSLPKDPRVKYLGYVSDEYMPALYRGARMLAFPSIYEGFGMPILEAFASNVPVITSRTSAMLEVGGNAVLFVDPYNSKDIEKTITALIEDKNLNELLIREGQRRLELYSWKKSADELLDTLEHFTPSPTF